MNKVEREILIEEKGKYVKMRFYCHGEHCVLEINPWSDSIYKRTLTLPFEFLERKEVFNELISLINKINERFKELVWSRYK